MERKGKKERTEGGEEGENREKLSIKQINCYFIFLMVLVFVFNRF
jgi:hypothetical protein